MELTTKQAELQVKQLVKGTILDERSPKGLAKFPEPFNNLLLPQFLILMGAHNNMADTVDALIGYVNILTRRIEELENA